MLCYHKPAVFLAGGLAALIICVGVVNACDPGIIGIHSPGGDSVVAGTIEVKAWVKEDLDWKKVDIHVDGRSIGADTIGPPFSVMWNTTTVADGEHTLKAYGTLGDGSVKDSETVKVTVKNKSD